jgi:hypothetical protein
MKICPKCGEDNDTPQPYCRECKRAYDRARHSKNRDSILARRSITVAARHGRILAELLLYFEGHPCKDCGEDNPIVLEFDHQKDKRGNVGDLLRKGSSWERILEEIEKCEVVCANCHRKRTAAQFSWGMLVLLKEAQAGAAIK